MSSPHTPRSTRKALFALLDADDRRRLWRVLALILVAAVFETVTIASILPFLDAVASPAALTERAHLAWLYDRFGFESRRAFVIALGCATLGLLVIGNALVALSQWRLFRFANQLTRRLSGRLLGAYLRAPYTFHLSRSAADLTRGVLGETEQVVQGIVLPGLFIVSRALVSTLIVLMLVVVEPFVALIAMVLLGGAYASVLALTRRHIHRAGELRNESSQRRFQLASESLGAIREVKIYECEDAFGRRFDEAGSELARASTSQQSIANLPKYAVEVLAFGSVVLLAVIMIATGRSASSGIALLGLFAFAGYRLAPALQTCFSSLTSIRYSLPALERLENDLRSIPVHAVTIAGGVDLPPPTTEIRLDDVTFVYSGRDDPVFEHLSLSIPVGSSVAIVGPTGSGKSTLLDLLCSLLRPREGHLVVDGRRLTDDDIRGWRRHIAYVSQHSVLVDASIRENVAFGHDHAAIDEERVRDCVRFACLTEYVEQELPEGYETRIGDRGARMSGGQRQRLAIARALYSQRPVIVLDEATSALDPETEGRILQNLHLHRASRTLVLVTHRPALAEGADHLYDMRKLMKRIRVASAEVMPKER